MGNENKENENIEELVCENNPFADSSNKETEEKTEEAKVCEDAISSLKDEIDKINNQYIRLAADFDNYRKRQMQERESLLKYGAEETLKKMIEALDNIDRAKKSVENIDDVNTVKESYELVSNRFMTYWPNWDWK